MAISIQSPDTPNHYNNDIPTPPPPPSCSGHTRSFSETNTKDRYYNLSGGSADHQPDGRHKNNSYMSTVRNGSCAMRENLLAKADAAMASLLVRLDQVAAQCSASQAHGGGRLMCEEKFQVGNHRRTFSIEETVATLKRKRNVNATQIYLQLAKDELTTQSLRLVHSSKMLVIAMSDPGLPELPENLAVCLTVLRKLTELCQDLSDRTTAPLQTRNLILKVHEGTAAFRHLITSNVDRSSRATIEEHLAAEAESLANVLTTLLRSLRVFSP